MSLPSTLEAQYVASTVGTALSQGLAEIIQKRPADPVEYLANYLYKYNENKIQKQKEIDMENLIVKLKKEKELEEKRKEEMKKEMAAIKIREEELRKEKEAEERRKKELEELAKRKAEIANLAPALPSLVEDEESQLVEFGDTKLHQLAAVAGSNLTHLLKENTSPAVRNSQFKTPRDIAVELNLQDNVKQIDEFIHELVTQENYKQLMDLVIMGFEDLLPIIEAKFGGEEKMRDNGLSDQADQIYTVFPQIQAKIEEIKKNIEAKDLIGLKVNLERRALAFYRDKEGKSPLHSAVEKGHFEIAIFLLEKCPLLSKLNDCYEKFPIDYLKAIDSTALDESDAALFAKLTQLLS